MANPLFNALGGQQMNPMSQLVAGAFFNTSITTFIEIPCGCCVTVSVENVSDTTAIDLTNGNIIFDRVS